MTNRPEGEVAKFCGAPLEMLWQIFAHHYTQTHITSSMQICAFKCVYAVCVCVSVHLHLL